MSTKGPEGTLTVAQHRNEIPGLRTKVSAYFIMAEFTHVDFTLSLVVSVIPLYIIYVSLHY